MVYPRIYHEYTMFMWEVYIYVVYTRHTSIPGILYRKKGFQMLNQPASECPNRCLTYDMPLFWYVLSTYWYVLVCTIILHFLYRSVLTGSTYQYEPVPTAKCSLPKELLILNGLLLQ